LESAAETCSWGITAACRQADFSGKGLWEGICDPFGPEFGVGFLKVYALSKIFFENSAVLRKKYLHLQKIQVE
jgi:hypothetical protein